MKIRWATRDDAEVLIPILTALHLHDVPGAITPSADLLLDHVRLLTDEATPHRLAIACDDSGSAIGLAAVGRFVSVSDPRPQAARQFEL